MKMRNKILLAEDDHHLGNLLSDYLQSEGFAVSLYRDGEAALEALKQNAFDLCLLDVMMPRLDGFALARAIRSKDKKIPVIFITAKSLKEDKLKGYETGADDYITKPFDEEELLWKIKAFLRHAPDLNAAATPQVVSIGRYRFDFSNQLLILDEHSRRITEKESEILHYLQSHRNKVIKREELLTSLWGENDYFLGRSLDVFITKIRKYLKEDGDISIENVFGVGFVFNVKSAE
ncbi:MAG: response regulator transcription factor [Bacteroidetes bacterium]|nr:response regulator transcription factor [Bacteroidota bacterium]